MSDPVTPRPADDEHRELDEHGRDDLGNRPVPAPPAMPLPADDDYRAPDDLPAPRPGTGR